MSLLARRLIFYALLMLFIIAAPLLLAYATGYRWSFTQRRIVKIGAISLQSIPSGASITLNGNLHKTRTPSLITDLTPGRYNVALEREGYHRWEKTLTVEDEKTSFAHAAVLFKRSTPEFKGPYFETGPLLSFPQNFRHYMVFYDSRLDKIIVVDNEKQKRAAELEGNSAVWRENPVPLLFAYSRHAVWQFNPDRGTRTLLTRLLDPILQVIVLPKLDALILIVGAEVRALELDQRDRQNSWMLAIFDEIKTATLAKDGETLEILGTYEGKAGMWELGLW